jgi:hypothetical protein
MKKRIKSKKHHLADVVAVALLPAVLLYVLNLIFNAVGVYAWNQLPWFDIPMHLLGGASIAWAAWSLMVEAYRRRVVTAQPWWFLFFALLGMVMLVGVLWEMYEFSMDVLRGLHLQGGLTDTMKDLFDDLVGGTVFLLMLRRPSATIFSRKK